MTPEDQKGRPGSDHNSEERYDPKDDMDHRDLVISLIYSVYRSILEPERWSLVLRELQRLLNADACDISIYDFAARRGEIALHAGCYDDALLKLYRTDFAPLNPWMQREEFYSRPELIWPGTAIVPEAKLVGGDFYNNWLRPQGLHYRLSTVLCREERSVVYLSALRSRDAGDFDSDRLYPLHRLVPHIRQVLELHRLLVGDVWRSRCALAEVVRRLGQATAVLGAERRLLAADRLAEDIPAHATAAFHGDDQGIAPERAAQEIRPACAPRGVAAATPGGAALGLVVDRPEPEQMPAEKERLRWWPLVIRESRGGSQGQARDAAPAARSGDADEEKLRRLYGLTQAEARVAILLASGLSLRGVAQQLDVGVTTIRTHLQRIFGKTYTHHQAQLVALLLAGPAKLTISFQGEADDDEAEGFG